MLGLRAEAAAPTTTALLMAARVGQESYIF